MAKTFAADGAARASGDASPEPAAAEGAPADPALLGPALLGPALLDRARKNALAGLDRAELNDLVRDLRARKKALADAEDADRKPITQALRRAVEEKRAREDGADEGEDDAPRTPGKGGKRAGHGAGAGARTDLPAAGARMRPAEIIDRGDTAAEPVAKPAGKSDARAEREARRQANIAERAARKEARQAGERLTPAKRPKDDATGRDGDA